MFDWLFTCQPYPHTILQLEPVAGLGVGIGLAYLNLEKFRYRGKIRTAALAAETELKGNGEKSYFKDSGHYKRIKALSSLSNHDQTDPAIKPRAEVPDGFWPKTYRHLFETHKDRRITIFLTGFLMALVFLGVGSDIGFLSAIDCVFPQWLLDCFYVVAVFATCFPVICVRLGNGVVGCMLKLIDHDKEELMLPLVRQAQEAGVAQPARRVPPWIGERPQYTPKPPDEK